MTRRAPTLTWYSHVAVHLGFFAGAAAFAGCAAWFFVSGNPPGGVLLTIAAVSLAVLGLVRQRRRPALVATPEMLTVRLLRGPMQVPRDDVVEVRVMRVGGLGPRSTLLRLESCPGGARGRDGHERLDVFNRLDLGADPREVGETLRALGYPLRSAG